MSFGWHRAIYTTPAMHTVAYAARPHAAKRGESVVGSLLCWRNNNEMARLELEMCALINING
eukprot:scaffold659124_cov65-Prasinocladus_malaysianus.AAC.1